MLSVDVVGVAQAHAPGGGGYFDEPTTVTIDDVDLASLIPEGKEYGDGPRSGQRARH